MVLRSGYNNMLATSVASFTETTVLFIAARHGITRSVANRRLIETVLVTPALFDTIGKALHDRIVSVGRGRYPTSLQRPCATTTRSSR